MMSFATEEFVDGGGILPCHSLLHSEIKTEEEEPCRPSRESSQCSCSVVADVKEEPACVHDFLSVKKEVDDATAYTQNKSDSVPCIKKEHDVYRCGGETFQQQTDRVASTQNKPDCVPFIEREHDDAPLIKKNLNTVPSIIKEEPGIENESISAAEDQNDVYRYDDDDIFQEQIPTVAFGVTDESLHVVEGDTLAGL